MSNIFNSMENDQKLNKHQVVISHCKSRGPSLSSEDIKNKLLQVDYYYASQQLVYGKDGGTDMTNNLQPIFNELMCNAPELFNRGNFIYVNGAELVSPTKIYPYLAAKDDPYSIAVFLSTHKN